MPFAIRAPRNQLLPRGCCRLPGDRGGGSMPVPCFRPALPITGVGAQGWRRVLQLAHSLSAAQPPSSLKAVLTTAPCSGLLSHSLRADCEDHACLWADIVCVPWGLCACRVWELTCVSVGLHTFQGIPSAKASFPLRPRHPPLQANPLPWQQEAEA